MMRCWILLAFVLFGASVEAQTLSGTVLDAESVPLVGATLHVVGTTTEPPCAWTVHTPSH